MENHASNVDFYVIISSDIYIYFNIKWPVSNIFCFLMKLFEVWIMVSSLTRKSGFSAPCNVSWGWEKMAHKTGKVTLWWSPDGYYRLYDFLRGNLKRSELEKQCARAPNIDSTALRRRKWLSETERYTRWELKRPKMQIHWHKRGHEISGTEQSGYLVM